MVSGKKISKIFQITFSFYQDERKEEQLKYVATLSVIMDLNIF
jgi:hypothetical protein